MIHDRKSVAEMRDRFADIRYRLDVVTPEVAQAWAATYASQERPSRAYEAKVEAYAQAMVRKQWVLNGEPIIFSGERLVSGLARCLACVKADVPFPSLIVDGVPEEALATLDTHLKRTARDVLGINGEAYPVALATACQVVTRYLNAPDRSRFVMGRGCSLSSQEIEALVEQDPGLRESARIVTEDFHVTKVLSHGAATAAHYIMAKADREAADEFMMILGDEGDNTDRAAGVLRARLLGIRNDERKGATPLTFRLALVAKAWNRRNAAVPPTPQALNFHGICENKSLGNEAFPVFDGVPADVRIDLGALVTSQQGGEGPVSDPVLSVFDSAIVVEHVFVEWKEAERMLKANGPLGGNGNRKIRKPHVDGLARDMRANRFVFNGETLKFSETGRILDGQHRLTASVQGKVGFWTLVVRGLPDSVFSTYDTGRRQGLGTKMIKEGVTYAFQTSSAINALWRITNNMESGDPTNQEGLAFAKEHPGIGESAKFVQAGKGVLQGAVAGPLHYLFKAKDKAEADRFFTQLANGADLSVGDPVHTLRERLLANRKRFSASDNADITRLVIRAWNARREGRTAPRLVSGGGPGYPSIA